MDPYNGGAAKFRPLANFRPDTWGEVFLNYTPIHEADQKQQEQEVNILKEEVQKELLMPIVKDPKERLLFIDAIQRLGLAYHFEQQIEVNLQEFHKNCVSSCNEDDLQYASLRFRLLRQHGFCISCDVFEKFKNKNGSFMDCLSSDVQGILSLYEASHLRLNGENVLDEALAFTTTHLTSLASSLSSPLAEQITHALKRPLFKRTTGIEAKYQITIYELNASHHVALLRLAKLNFNLLQLLYKEELRDLFRWTKNLDYERKFPFARTRVAESFFWSVGVCYEPNYSYARRILSKFTILITAVDDIYDSYGNIDELELFTEAILRWNSSCMIQLPDFMKFIYQILLDTIQELEQDLANEGRSHNVSYIRKEFEFICQAYLQEVRWLQQKYIPTYDEYIRNGIISSSIPLMLMVTFQCMDEIASNKEALEWIYQESKAMKASCIISRIMNDMAGHKVEQERNHVASSVECYMANFGVTQEDAYKELEKRVEEEWKNVRAEMFQPTVVPRALLMRILNACRAIYDLYKQGEDGFTNVKALQPQIEALFMKPLC